jgi:hypothetical protein
MMINDANVEIKSASILNYFVNVHSSSVKVVGGNTDR